jgi:hypothetical protein
MTRRFLVLLLIAGALTFLVIYSLMDLMGWIERAKLPKIKKTLLEEARLVEIHHLVYDQIGEWFWEETAKPAFIREITLRTIRDTGELFPGVQDILKWAREHPEEAQELMRRYGPPEDGRPAQYTLEPE